MYLLAFAQFVLLGRLCIKRPYYVGLGWTNKDLEDLLFAGVLGVVLGGRIGYSLFYMPEFYLANPLSILKIWEGGMSFHGGLLGVILAMVWFARRKKTSFWTVSDLVAPLVPFGLAFGRLGNFLNGELWGRPTDLPWAMVFPLVDAVPRHPSQIYQLLLEGVLLGLVLWIYASKPRRLGQISGLFLLGYGVCRFLVEFAREPDAFLGLLGLGLSMGQWLSIPMILFGIYFDLVLPENAFMLELITKTRNLSKALSAVQRLNSERGESNAVSMANDVIDNYRKLSKDQHVKFFTALIEKLSPDAEKVMAAAQAFAAEASARNYIRLQKVSESPRQEFIRRLNRGLNGTAAVVEIRRDLLQLLDKKPELAAVDFDMRHLLSSWFNPGFLKMHRVDWKSPAEVLEKLIQHEAVHAIDGWDDLRRRLQPDRRCFAFFHPQLPNEPLIFVEVALLP